MAISKNLKLARIMAELTQEEASEKVGVSRQTMSNWENDKTRPDIVNIMTLSNIYNVRVELLLSSDREILKHLGGSKDTVATVNQDAANL